MHAILRKVKRLENDTSEVKDFSEYRGYYEWKGYGEWYVSTWEGKLVILPLLSNTPAESMELYESIGEDKFRRIKEGRKLGPYITFERNSDGAIVRYRYENYIYDKIKE
jgi:hypothetical protein